MNTRLALTILVLIPLFSYSLYKIFCSDEKAEINDPAAKAVFDERNNYLCHFLDDYIAHLKGRLQDDDRDALELMAKTKQVIYNPHRMIYTETPLRSSNTLVMNIRKNDSLALCFHPIEVDSMKLSLEDNSKNLDWLLRFKDGQGNASDAPAYLHKFNTATYALVLEELAYGPPVLNKTDNTYTKGFTFQRVNLLDMAKRKNLGHFYMYVENDDYIDIGKLKLKYGDNALARLNQNLTGNLFRNLYYYI